MTQIKTSSWLEGLFVCKPAYHSIKLLPSFDWLICFYDHATTAGIDLVSNGDTVAELRNSFLLGPSKGVDAGEDDVARDLQGQTGADGRQDGLHGGVAARGHVGFGAIARVILARYPTRALLGLVLMVAQAFFYNAIFFTYALVLTKFYSVPSADVGWYILPFAAGNFMGPLVLGRFFDTIGRRPMIIFTYAMSGVMLAGAGWLFARDLVTADVWATAAFAEGPGCLKHLERVDGVEAIIVLPDGGIDGTSGFAKLLAR